MNNKTILFVDNDSVSQTKYQKRLESEGFHLECAQDGQVALDILSERSPDLVLLDPMLPKVSGADVLKFMNADPRLTTVPVIIFSNTPMTEVPPDSPLAWGAKRLLKSDCTFPKLLETIQETLVATPEFVVVETEKTPSTQQSVTSTGEGKRNGADAVATPNPEIVATKGRVEFPKEALGVMPKIREHSMGYLKAPSSKAGQDHLSGLHQRVQLLNASAAQAGCARVALLTNALEALLSGILDKPAAATQSVPQTVAQAVDCLDGLLKSNDGYSLGPPIQAKVLVVDDDTVCNHVNVTSLKRASFNAVGVKDPAAALNLMESTPFDLVLLDVNMPGLTGFDVCEKLRRLPKCRKTPVIFVTAFNSFDNRKQSVLSGGNDFVSKPIFPLELALKVTVNLIKTRVEGTRTPQLETNSATTSDSQDVLQPTASTRINRPVNAEGQPPESPAKLIPTGEPDTENAKTADIPIETKQPGTEALPTNSIPQHVLQPSALALNGQQKNGDAPSAEIHNRLRQSTAELERAKTGLEQESAERARVESQWREQLSTARALVEQTETVLKEKEARCSQLEKDLTGLKHDREELQNKFAAEQQAAAKSQQEIKDSQERLRQGTAELERAKTTTERQSAEHTRLESELREQLNAAKAAAGKTETTLKERETRCGELEMELAGLQQERDELQKKLTTEQQAVGKSQREFKELHERLSQSNAELERTKAGLEQQSAERMRLESEWREQLNMAKAAAGKTETVLKEKETRCGELEKELTGLQQLRDELQNKFATEQQAFAKSQQEIKELQAHLRQGGAELECAKASLEQESAKRLRLESEYQNLADAKEALKLELAGLRESQAGREAERRDKQKKLVEGLRENIQHLQLRLQEAEAFNGDSEEGSNSKPR